MREIVGMYFDARDKLIVTDRSCARFTVFPNLRAQLETNALPVY